MTQSMDVQLRDPVRLPDSPKGKAEKSGTETNKAEGNARADTARKGSSFLAIIEKMLAGAKDSAASVESDGAAGTTGRGAGGARIPNVGNGRTETDETAEPAVSGKLKGGRRAKSAAAAETGAAQEHRIAKGAPGSNELGAGAGKASSSDQARSAGVLDQRQTFADTLESRAAKGAESTEKESATERDPRKRAVDPKSANPSTAGYAMGGAIGISAKNPICGASDRATADEEAGKIREAKGQRRERGAVIGVVDERSSPVAEAAKNADTVMESAVKDTGSGTAEMTISFRDDGPGRQGGGMYRLSDGSESKTMSFQEALTQQLRSNAQDFVRAGQIVLRDHDSGSIRLNLHPESLGHVRINLELNDRKISGRIVVSSKEAYEAFKESLDGIRAAFADSGFDSEGFDLSWSGSGAESGGGDGRGALSSPFYASSIPDVMSPRFSADSETGGQNPYGSRAVNVYA